MGKFRILALDGASITGGQGWLSSGLLRDSWERLATFSVEASKNYQETIQSADSDPLDEALLFGCDAIDEEREVYRLTLKRFVYLWRRYYLSGWIVGMAQSSVGTEPERMGPLMAEMGAMALGCYLRAANKNVQHDIMEELRTVATAPPDHWRQFAATKNLSVDIENAKQAIHQGVDQSVSLLLEKPGQFLALRWVNRKCTVPILIRHCKIARAMLTQVVKEGILENSNFGLNHIDLIAGTSSGGLNSLLFAQHRHFLDALDESILMWQEMDRAMAETMNQINCSKISQLVGLRSFFGDSAKAVYQRFFGEGNLGDLKRKVAITTVQLDSGDVNAVPVLRRWKAMVYHNFPKEELAEDPSRNTDRNFAGVRLMPNVKDSFGAESISIHEAAVSTSAAPLMSPVYIGENRLPLPGAPIQQSAEYTHSFVPPGSRFIRANQSGFIDGGVYANNPSLMGMMVAMQTKKVSWNMDRLTLVSMGNGKQARDHAEVKTPDLGYLPWLANRERPGLLIDVMLDVGVDATTACCASFLGDLMKRYNVWSDVLFFSLNSTGPSIDNIELQLDENLGIHRYIYQQEPGNLRRWLERYWQEGLEDS